MEQALATIHSLKKSRGSVSLEIGTYFDRICFFARTKKRFAPLVESQIYAQYPDIDVEEVPEDIFVPKEGEEAYTAYLKLADPEVFPVKRHPQFDDLINRISIDPLSGITAAFTKFPKAGMRGHLSISIRPIRGRYRQRALKFLPLIARGFARRWSWYRTLFCRVHLARGWRRLVYWPIDLLMGGYRSIFQGMDLLQTAGWQSTTLKVQEDPDIRESGRSHDMENPLQAAKDKSNQLLFETTIRITIIAKKGNRKEGESKLQEIASSFKQFDLPQCNAFVRSGREPRPFLLGHEEIATIWHLPTVLVKTPTIDWVQSRLLEPPSEFPIDGVLTFLGESVFRGKRTKFGIRQDDRRRHVYTIGKTGMGKSTLLENMVFADIHTGKGVAVIDPHGDLADAVLRMIPKERTNDVVLFDPTDADYPISFNMLECKNPEQRSLIASGLMAVFTKIWPDVWSGRMEHILRNTLLALLESLGIMRMYADDAFKNKIVSHLSDPLVRSFWEDEYGSWSEKFRTEAVSAIQNKVGQLLSTPVIRNIVGQVTSTLDIRHAMDSGKIIITNLSKGKLGEDNSNFLGSMLVTKFQIDAMSRSDIPENDRRDFYLYVDEFQNFATTSFATILSEARKYRMNLTMANQFTGQLTPDKSNTMLKDAVFGNVGTIVSFQVGSEDAEEIAKQFGDENLEEDIVGLPKYNAYMRLMIDGLTSRPFSVSTLPPPKFEQDKGRIEKIRKHSRERYAEKRLVVEGKIKKWAHSAKAAKTEQRTEMKAREKELEEIKKAKRKGMKLGEYRKWRDREMWTNAYNALKKKMNTGSGLSEEEKKAMEELQKKLNQAGGATVSPADPDRSRRVEPTKNPKAS
jgi:hypothetical protein